MSPTKKQQLNLSMAVFYKKGKLNIADSGKRLAFRNVN